MYTGHSIAIPLGFIILTGLLCWHLAYAKGRWWLKLAFTVLLVGFGLEVSRALDSYAGWPTGEEMPENGQLLGAVIREPSPRVGDKGAIYVWIRPLEPPVSGLLRETPSPDEPRAYRLPYSREMHEEMEQAMQALRSGQPVGIGRGRRGGHHGQPGQGSGSGSGEGQGNGSLRTDDDDVHVYALPPPQPPRKDDKSATTPAPQ